MGSKAPTPPPDDAKRPSSPPPPPPPRASGCYPSSAARYNVLTWDPASDQYTEQDEMVNPCLNVTLAGLLRALRELKTLGYSCHRFRDEDGNYHSDSAVLVERVDDVLIDTMEF